MKILEVDRKEAIFLREQIVCSKLRRKIFDTLFFLCSKVICHYESSNKFGRFEMIGKLVVQIRTQMLRLEVLMDRKGSLNVNLKWITLLRKEVD